jgi:hypothetical protein
MMRGPNYASYRYMPSIRRKPLAGEQAKKFMS